MLSRILVDGYKSIDRSELELSNFTLLAGSIRQENPLSFRL